MNKRILLFVPILVVFGPMGWLIAQKQTANAPTWSGPTTAAIPPATLNAPTTTTERLTIHDPSGTRRQIDVTNQTGQTPLPSLKTMARQGRWLTLTNAGVARKTNTLAVLDEATKTLRQTPIPAHLVIGYAGDEAFFFRSTRYAPNSNRVELNEIGAYNLQTGRERTIDTLSEHFSFAKEVEGTANMPKGKATVTADTLRVEVYFEGAALFPGQERLPIEIHTIPLTTSTTPPRAE